MGCKNSETSDASDIKFGIGDISKHAKIQNDCATGASRHIDKIYSFAVFSFFVTFDSSNYYDYHRFLCKRSLWSPYVIGQTIIFLPCDFYLSFFFFFFFLA